MNFKGPPIVAGFLLVRLMLIKITLRHAYIDQFERKEGGSFVNSDLLPSPCSVSLRHEKFYVLYHVFFSLFVVNAPCDDDL